MIDFPRMVKVLQEWTTHPIDDLARAIREEFNRVRPQETIRPGQTVAVTAGSRGINNIAGILKCIVDELIRIQARPFIVPAMGSHGGATVEGQTSILAHYGITAETMQVPIKATMAVRQVGVTQGDIPVYLDRAALEADHIFIVNRVKPHTDFEANIESGLMKMMAIGLANQEGADRCHNEFMERGHFAVITSVARVVLEKAPIAFGLAVVENQRDETEVVQLIPAAEIEESEKKLLLLAKAMLPRIPLSKIDLLIVNQMGKNFSGTGMDQNVIARTVVPFHKVPAVPAIQRIFVRDASPDSEGNLLGIGNADFITQRLIDKIDRHATYMNAMTSNSPEMARIPASYVCDREAIATAFSTLVHYDPKSVKVVQIENTLKLGEIFVSEALMPEISRNGDLRIVAPLKAMTFDADGQPLH